MTLESIRGMRDVPTTQGLNNRSLPNTRSQAVTEVARLEHEKARLERELKMWVENQKKTEARLQKVEERLALLQETLAPSNVDDSGKRTPVRHRSSARNADHDEGAAQRWHEIPLEY